MALSLGTLFVKLNADPSQLTQGLNQAASKIEQFGNRLKNTSEKLTQLGMAMSAAGIGAVAVAAQFDAGVKSSLDELKATTTAISVDIGRSFVPAMEKLNSVLTFFGNVLKNVDPSTKEAMATFITIGGVVLLVAGGIAKLVAVAMQLAPVLASAVAPAIKAVSAAFLPLLALLSVMLVTVPLIADEWTNFTTFMRNSWNKALKSIAAAWEGVKTWFFETVNAIGQAWSQFTGKLWELFAKAMKKVGEYAAKIAAKFGLDWSNELDAFNATIDDMASQGFQPIVDMSKNVGAKIGASLSEGFEYAKNMIVPGYESLANKIVSGSQKIKNGIKSMFDGLLEGMDKPLQGLALLSKGVEKPKAKAAETMTFEAIDVYGKVGKKAVETTASFEAGVKLAGDNLLQGLGSFTEVMNAAQAGMQAGGPWGALAAAAAALLMKSEAFRKLVEELNGFISIVADQLGENLLPVFQLLGALLRILAPVILMLNKVLSGPLLFALKLFAKLVLTVVAAIGFIVNPLLQFAAWLVGDVIGGFLGLFNQAYADAAKSFADTIRAGKVDMEEVFRSMSEIERGVQAVTPPDTVAEIPINDLGQAASNTASTLNELNAALTNVPAGFKIAAARFNATAPGNAYFYNPSADREFNVNLYMDGKQITTAVAVQSARNQYAWNGQAATIRQPPDFWPPRPSFG